MGGSSAACWCDEAAGVPCADPRAGESKRPTGDVSLPFALEAAAAAELPTPPLTTRPEASSHLRRWASFSCAVFMKPPVCGKGKPDDPAAGEVARGVDDVDVDSAAAGPGLLGGAYSGGRPCSSAMSGRPGLCAAGGMRCCCCCSVLNESRDGARECPAAPAGPPCVLDDALSSLSTIHSYPEL
jgi:hypothetical protein